MGMLAQRRLSKTEDVMDGRQYRWILWSELILAWLVLLALFYYTYVELVRAPYIGFNYSATDGYIQDIFVPDPAVDLREGDLLYKVNDVLFEDWRQTLPQSLFPPAPIGEHLRLEVRRGEQLLVVPWVVADFNWNEFESRAFNVWWFGYLFWGTGLATLLLVRPLDSKRSLFAAFFFLTALWLVIGNTSRWGISESRILYRVALVFSVPVLLHLHWLFPRPLGKIPPWLLWTGYGGSLVIALLHWTPLISGGLSSLLFGLALLGCVALLVAHYYRQPEARQPVRLLFWGFLFAILPVAILTLLYAFQQMPHLGTFALATLPMIPGIYFYLIYRFQLGGSEFRANRVIALYLYLILLGTGLLIAVSFLSNQAIFVGNTALWSTLLGMVAALTTVYGFPPFQRLVESRLLAMPLPSVKLIDTYLARITATLNEASLIHLLKDEVVPSLLIRQSALLRITNNEATTIYSTGEELTEAQLRDLVAYFKQHAIYRLRGMKEFPTPSWVKLGLALQVEGKLIGLWLLGRHDPDDLYAAVEIATLQTLARQTALALGNIEQSAQLQALYQVNIERQEQERMKMAHFLHDAILNQAAILYMSLDAATLTPTVQANYELLKEQIHQMISNLRPPSLDLGLGAALEELAGELDQRAQIRFALRLNVTVAELHYPAQIENHIFRIVQQACENAFRHGRAQVIEITGTLAPDHVELLVEDDGVGFTLNKPLNMAYLIAHKHYGLVHMFERAEHISAELALESTPGRGTRVHLLWWRRAGAGG
jgi:signal transduction histidine kinase